MHNLTNKIKNALFAEYSANNISLLELARFIDDAESETLLNIINELFEESRKEKYVEYLMEKSLWVYLTKNFNSMN